MTRVNNNESMKDLLCLLIFVDLKAPEKRYCYPVNDSRSTKLLRIVPANGIIGTIALKIRQSQNDNQLLLPLASKK